MTRTRLDFAALTFALSAISFGATALNAQTLDAGAKLQAVAGVEVFDARQDGGPVLLLSTKSGRLRMADGVYQSADRTTLSVKNGQLLEVREPTTEIRSLKVLSVESVAVRAQDERERLFFKDSRGVNRVVPDGRFENRDGQVLVVKDGTIVAYGLGR